MKNYHKLNLPKDPLKIKDFSCYDIENFWTIETNPKNILSDELNQIFFDIGVHPSFAVFFVVHANHRKDKHEYAHIDYTLSHAKWKPIPFGINWELNTNISSKLCWYDTSNCKEIEISLDGDPEVDRTYEYLNGTFFEGTPKVIDSVECTGEPILVRTDIAHTVSDFVTIESKRISFSLRFDVEKISSWKDAEYVFRNICL
jgi:hypothetical protein